MTILPISIEKSAATLVEIFGDTAPAHARERMDEYDGDVDKDGHKFWLAVANEALRLLERERVVRREVADILTLSPRGRGWRAERAG